MMSWRERVGLGGGKEEAEEEEEEEEAASAAEQTLLSSEWRRWVSAVGPWRRPS